MKSLLSILAVSSCLIASLITPTAIASEESYEEALNNFKHAEETAKFFDGSYGYALFPTVGKGGIGIGGAYGKGKVFKDGNVVGESSLKQLSIGLQLGGQAYSEIIFFEDEKSFKDFTSGSFEFGAQASAVAINMGVNVQTGTTGNSAGAGQSGGSQKAKGSYVNGMAVFTAAKGGLMYEASLAGQAFSFEPVGK
ncbi:hypothetical protein L9G16_14650 [Shewanella sp. A25]|nr:hypothetical protein [Shewanella shenzhenensis]